MKFLESKINMLTLKSKKLSYGGYIIGVYPKLKRDGCFDYFGLTTEEFSMISSDGIISMPNGEIALDLNIEIDLLKYTFISNHSAFKIHNNIYLWKSL